jgi:hypothetical protein
MTWIWKCNVFSVLNLGAYDVLVLVTGISHFFVVISKKKIQEGEFFL